jgi:hypothetical protein
MDNLAKTQVQMNQLFLILIVLLALPAIAADAMRPALVNGDGQNQSWTACPFPEKANRTVRVTVINKSEMPVQVRMTGKCWEQIYFIRLEEGDRVHPTEASADVIQDEYRFEIFYTELWDPVYGYECGEGSNSAVVNHRTRLTVLECSNKTPNNGERPAILKYPQGAGRGGGFRRR